jgi:hypothetical protein
MTAVHDRKEGRMSYLTQYADRRPASAPKPRRGARVDERTLLNRPDFDGGAYVRAFVEDTSGRKLRWRKLPPEPRIRLRISDCMNEIALEFSLESAELRENALFKIDTLLGALERFRAGLQVEAELYAAREGAASRPKLGRVLSHS